MTAKQFEAAVTLAKSGVEINEDTSNLFGFGLDDFKPTATTIGAVAKTINWQCAIWDGTWDMTEMDNIRKLSRKRFIIVG